MIDLNFYNRCIQTLEQAYTLLKEQKPDTISYDLYRSACIKEFEIILEQSGKLLKKALKAWFHSPKAVDKLTFKDVFRHAAKHDLISLEVAERWLKYRDNRNVTAHDYGFEFAENTLTLLPKFLEDAKALATVLSEINDDTP